MRKIPSEQIVFSIDPETDPDSLYLKKLSYILIVIRKFIPDIAQFEYVNDVMKITQLIYLCKSFSVDFAEEIISLLDELQQKFINQAKLNHSHALESKNNVFIFVTKNSLTSIFFDAADDCLAVAEWLRKEMNK